MNGSLTLELACVQGQTRPVRVLAVPPLQCSRARYDSRQPHIANMTLLHLGGVLQGDCLNLDITLAEEAAARIATAAATQVYRMPEREAAQTLHITIQAGARLDYLPEPTILFAGARFTQATQVRLHNNGMLVLREIVVGGRLARGELHAYERYHASFEVRDEQGRCLLAERTRLEPALFSPVRIGVQAEHPVVGSLYLLARGADLQHMLEVAREALRQHPRALAEAGMLPNECGVLVRTLGATVKPVRDVLDAVASVVRCAG